MTTPLQTDPQAALGDPGEQCAHCGAPLATDQRYCVNCGLRRAAPRVEYRELLLGEAPAAAPAPPPAPDPVGAVAPPAPAAETRAVSPLGAAVAIGLLLLATLLGAVIGRGSGGDGARAPVVVGAAQGAPATAAASVTDEWTGGDGWTVQIQAFAKDGTQPAQVAQAKSDAQAKGADGAGVLISDTYPSLPAGQYVIFAGRYDSKAAAEKALAPLKASFPDATVVRVSTTASDAGGSSGGSGASKGGASTGGADPATQQQLQDLQNSSPEDYVKKSKKLPDKVGTGGAPPPKDQKAPGGGSGGGSVIG